MTKTPWYESDNPDRVARGLGGRVALWIVLSIVFFAIIGAAAWGIKVATSDVQGQGDALRKKNSADNRIAAQERFEERYQDILAADRRLAPLKAAADANPADRTAAQTYTGAVSYCMDAVAEYNADARKYTAEEFRSVDLPFEIDNLDPATDCKEN